MSLLLRKKRKVLLLMKKKSVIVVPAVPVLIFAQLRLFQSLISWMPGVVFLISPLSIKNDHTPFFSSADW